MSSTSLPTCRHCQAPATSPSSLAIYDDNNKLTGYRRGICRAHQRQNLWDRQRPETDQYETGCPSCGCSFLALTIDWSTPTQSSRGAEYRPYYSELDIEEWSFAHDGAYGLSWDSYFDSVVESIFHQANQLDPPYNNALADSTGARPTTVADYFDNDQFEVPRRSLFHSITTSSACDSCGRELPTEWY